MWIGLVQLIYFLDALVFFAAFLTRRRPALVAAVVIGGVGMLLHLGWIVARGLQAGHLPLTGTFETLVVFSFLVMGLYFIVLARYGVVGVGGFAALIASLVLAASSLLSAEIEPLLPSLQSNWLLFHVLSCLAGYAAFALAFGSAGLFLVGDLVREKLNQRFGEAAIREKLGFLDEFTYQTIAAGFPLLTLGVVTGAVWANLCWGSYWSWDPKETWSLVTWLIYAACLHMRYTANWRGRAAAVIAALGFISVMFTYFGVNYWLSSIHAYN